MCMTGEGESVLGSDLIYHPWSLRVEDLSEHHLLCIKPNKPLFAGCCSHVWCSDAPHQDAHDGEVKPRITSSIWWNSLPCHGQRNCVYCELVMCFIECASASTVIQIWCINWCVPLTHLILRTPLLLWWDGQIIWNTSHNTELVYFDSTKWT